MTATNHALSGALIGAFLPLPVAIPVAIASHFVLDAVPHFSVNHHLRNKSSLYKTVVYTDTILALAVGAVAAIFQEWVMLLCGFLAYMPDIAVVDYYFRHGRDMDIKAENRFMRWHLGIQHEYPWGIFIEVPLTLIMLPIYISQLLKN